MSHFLATLLCKTDFILTNSSSDCCVLKHSFTFQVVSSGNSKKKNENFFDQQSKIKKAKPKVEEVDEESVDYIPTELIDETKMKKLK